jgi:replicative DNA helicase
VHVSIADDVRTQNASGPGTPPPSSHQPGQGSAGDASFDRTPPQDIAAEQSVLGGMLLSKDAIADVVEILRATDFYRPAHASVFDAVIDLYGRGEPADAVTVAAFMQTNGALARIGGAAYLHTLISSVPTAANAAYYARIVAERAVLRRLVEAGTRIVQMGYGTASGQGRDVDDVVDLAQQAVYDVLERRVSEDYAVLADLLQPALDEIEAVGARDGVMAGVPTGFGDLDRLLNGLHPGQLVIVAGRPGLGKALALDTPLPTPTGWTTMGGVAVGDLLLGADGRPTRVLATSEIMLGRRCYEVEFSDGTVIVADAEHQWVTIARAGAPVAANPSRSGAATLLAAPPVTVTTRQIAATLRHPVDGRPSHAVVNARALNLPARLDLPLPPYLLGGRLAGADAEGDIMVRIDAAYLRASADQRRELLAGLLDAAGTVAPARSTQLRLTSRALAEDVRELVVSLGYRCSLGESRRPYQGSVITFSTPPRPQSRSIVDVRLVPSVPVRCVSVDNRDHLYLASRSMVPTHNSTVAMDFARSASVRHNMSSVIFSLEMSKIEIVTRLLAAEARVPMHVLRSGQLSDDDWTRLARRMGEISEAPVFVDDTPNMTLMEIRAKARRLRQRHDLRLVVVDYLQLMTSPKRVESRQQEVADLSRGLKLLAKEIECPVIAVSQLNRGPEQRTDKRPQLSDLRESGSIEQDADVVILLHRDDYYDKESPRAGEADFIVAKHRNGPTDTVTVAAQLHFSRFVDMAVN